MGQAHDRAGNVECWRKDVWVLVTPDCAATLSDHDALDIVDADRVGDRVVKLRRLQRRVPGVPLRVRAPYALRVCQFAISAAKNSVGGGLRVFNV